jgi:hypothetical protein
VEFDTSVIGAAVGIRGPDGALSPMPEPLSYVVAWEWVMEDYGGSDAATQGQGTCRGGAYTTQKRQELLASFRRALPIDSRLPDVGFRIVLTDGRAARDDE